MSAHTPKPNDDRMQCPDCGHRLNAIPCPACGSKVWSEDVLKVSRIKEAAPEMFELLKEVMLEVGSDDFHEKYKNLIKKIEGEK